MKSLYSILGRILMRSDTVKQYGNNMFFLNKLPTSGVHKSRLQGHRADYILYSAA